MEEIKMKGPIIPVKSNYDSKTSNANESNIKNSLQDELQKLPFTTNTKVPKAVETTGETKN